MTEAEWLTCPKPSNMIRFLEHRTSDRKVRFFGCACCRRIWDDLTDPRSRAAVLASERFADGLISAEELREAADAGRAAAADAEIRARMSADRASPVAAAAATRTGDWQAAALVATAVTRLRGQYEGYEQCRLLRCLFNPFHLTGPDPAWLAWNGGTVPRLARGIYEDGAFRDLPVLADALEDAGCTDRAILNHCRGPGSHVRGCWVLDLILGKA